MLNGQRVVAVIPARAGSKAIVNKSIAPLGGRPLLAWPIQTAQVVPEIDRIIVSTDGDAIASVATEQGAEVYARPPRLAADTSLVIDALRDLIGRLRSEGETARWMLLLEATAPFRSPADVGACLLELAKDDVDSVATFTDAATKPAKAWTIAEGSPRPYLDGVDPWAPRQATPPAWELNGGCYGFVIDRLPTQGPNVLFGRSRAVLMPKERSLDINDALDLAFAELVLGRQAGAPSPPSQGLQP